MKRNKIFAGLVLVIFLFTIPQALAVDDPGINRPIEFLGEYESNHPSLKGEIEGIISENKDSIEGIITISKLKCDINLEKMGENGELLYYTGKITTRGVSFDMRLICRIISNYILIGGFAVPEINLEGYFQADII
jgi:hypothetical protein